MIRLDTINSFRMSDYSKEDENTRFPFEKAYGSTPQEFMDGYTNNRVIDVKGKIVVIAEGGCGMNPVEDLQPINICNIYVPEDCNETAKIVYAGHIAFLIYTSASGDEEIILYKPDECCPQTLKQYTAPWKEEESEAEWQAKDRGFKVEDIDTHIENIMKGLYDFNYKLTNREDVVILHGL